MNTKVKIQELKNAGFSNKKIADKIGCSYFTVCYHLNKDRALKQKKYEKRFRKENPLKIKFHAFIKNKNTIRFSINDLLLKIGGQPRCYLSGKPIDLNNGDSYSLDHVIPLSRGGLSNLDNLELCCSKINMCKRNLTKEEFISLCKDVATWQ